MKILMVSPMLPYGPGAMPVLLEAELLALSERHEVTLVTGLGDEAWEAAAADAIAAIPIEVHLADRRVPQSERQRLRRRARLASDWALTRRPWLTLWFSAPGIQTIIDQLTASRDYDLIAVEDSSMSMFRLPAGVPAVLSDYEIGRPQPPGWRWGGSTPLPIWAFRELDWRRWEAYQRSGWRRYDGVQVFTEYDARTIANQAPDVSPRVRVNPFGMVMPAPLDPAREESDNVLFVGNFTHLPNRDAANWMARDIMPRVRAAHPAARLRLVGSDPPADVLELAGNGVEVIADAPAVDPYLEAASVCAAPVRLGGGMRMKVLHALASGKAVVTTTRGAEGYGQPDDDRPLVVRDDTAGIAEGIVNLLQDDAGRRDLARRARIFAERFHSPAAWGARLEAVYEETIATAGA